MDGDTLAPSIQNKPTPRAVQHHYGCVTWHADLAAATFADIGITVSDGKVERPLLPAFSIAVVVAGHRLYAGRRPRLVLGYSAASWPERRAVLERADANGRRPDVARTSLKLSYPLRHESECAGEFHRSVRARAQIPSTVQSLKAGTSLLFRGACDYGMMVAQS